MGRVDSPTYTEQGAMTQILFGLTKEKTIQKLIKQLFK